MHSDQRQRKLGDAGLVGRDITAKHLTAGGQRRGSDCHVGSINAAEHRVYIGLAPHDGGEHFDNRTAVRFDYHRQFAKIRTNPGRINALHCPGDL